MEFVIYALFLTGESKKHSSFRSQTYLSSIAKIFSTDNVVPSPCGPPAPLHYGNSRGPPSVHAEAQPENTLDTFAEGHMATTCGQNLQEPFLAPTRM